MSPHEKIIFHFGNAKDPKTRQKVVPPNPLILLLEENRLLLEQHQEWTGQLSQLLPVGKAVRLGVQVSGNGFGRCCGCLYTVARRIGTRWISRTSHVRPMRACQL